MCITFGRYAFLIDCTIQYQTELCKLHPHL